MEVKNYANNKYELHLKIILTFILLQSLIDLLTSINMHFFPSSLTIGVVVRMAFMGYILLMVMACKPTSGFKNAIILYFVAVCLFGVIFIITNIYYKGKGCLFIEIKSLFRSFYFPVVLVGLIFIFKKVEIKISSIFLSYVLFGYTSIIFLATITGTNFYSYGPENYYYNTGSNGWFYAANEIGTIIGILLPYTFLYVLDLTKATKKRVLGFGILAILMLTFSVLAIATKVPLFSAIGYMIGFIFLYFIYYIVKKERRYLFKIFHMALILLVCSSVFIYTPAYKTVGDSFNKIFSIISQGSEPSGEPSTTANGSAENNNQYNQEELISVILSNRNTTTALQKNRFGGSPAVQKIVGMGISYQDSSGNFLEKTVEQDFGDMYFRYGVLGFIIILLPLIGCLIFLFAKVLLNIKKVFFSEEICTGLFSLVLALGIAAVSGHTLIAPAVSIFVVLDVVFLYQQTDELINNRLKQQRGAK